MVGKRTAVLAAIMNNMNNPAPEQPEQPPPPYEDPNPYGSPLTYGPEPPSLIEPDSGARTMGMLCHLTGLSWALGVPGFVGPLIIWLIKKDEMPFVDDQGKESLNFQITIFIATLAVVGIAIATCGIGAVLVPVVLVVDVVFCILGSVKANSGEYYRYPITIRLIT